MPKGWKTATCTSPACVEHNVPVTVNAGVKACKACGTPYPSKVPGGAPA